MKVQIFFKKLASFHSHKKEEKKKDCQEQKIFNQ